MTACKLSGGGGWLNDGRLSRVRLFGVSCAVEERRWGHKPYDEDEEGRWMSQETESECTSGQNDEGNSRQICLLRQGYLQPSERSESDCTSRS